MENMPLPQAKPTTWKSLIIMRSIIMMNQSVRISLKYFDRDARRKSTPSTLPLNTINSIPVQNKQST